MARLILPCKSSCLTKTSLLGLISSAPVTTHILSFVYSYINIDPLVCKSLVLLFKQILNYQVRIHLVVSITVECILKIIRICLLGNVVWIIEFELI